MLPTTSKSSTCSSSKPAQDDSSRFEEVPSSPSSSSASLDFSDAAPFPPLSQNTRQAGPNLSHSDIVAGLAREEEEESEDEHEDSVWWTPSELRVSSSLPPLQDEADLSPQDIIERATALKAQGNAEFGKGEWEDALVTYRDALVELPVRTQIAIKGKEKAAEGLAEEVEVEKLVEGVEALEVGKVEEAGTEDEGESQELRELRSMLFANCAACLLKLERWKEAVTACDDSLEDNPTYIKVLHRRALASESLASWSSLSSSLEDYNTLSSLSNIPLHLASTIQIAQKRLPGLIAAQQEKEKDEVMGKLKDLGNTVLGKFGLSTNNFKFVQQEGGGYSMNFER